MTNLWEEDKVFLNCEGVKEHIMLGTQTQAAAHTRYITSDVVAVHQGGATGGWEKTYTWKQMVTK